MIEAKASDEDRRATTAKAPSCPPVGAECGLSTSRNCMPFAVTLVIGSLVEFPGNDRLDVREQPRKGATGGEDEVGIPNAVSEATVFLHLTRHRRKEKRSPC